jgi:hypothetical protein
MYQSINRVTVRYGKFREYHSAMQHLNEICRERGWVQGRLLVPMAGVDNEYIMQHDYDSLANYEREGEAFYSDPEAMKVFRDAAAFVIEGTSRSEILQSAPVIE